MPIPERITMGDKYGPAMEIHDSEAAQKYFEQCVEHRMRFGASREEAERIERANLGSYAQEDADFVCVSTRDDETLAEGLRALDEGEEPFAHFPGVMPAVNADELRATLSSCED